MNDVMCSVHDTIHAVLLSHDPEIYGHVRKLAFEFRARRSSMKAADINSVPYDRRSFIPNLATLTRNVVRLGRNRLTGILATPTRTQHRALDLLGVTPTA